MNEEQVKALIAAETASLREAAAAAQTEAAAAKTEATRLKEALVLRDAGDFVVRKLKAIDMPEVTRQRLAERLPNLATIKDGALDETALTTAIEEAAKAEVAYLKTVTGGGRVVGMGASTAPVTVDIAESQKTITANLSRLTGIPARN